MNDSLTVLWWHTRVYFWPDCSSGSCRINRITLFQKQKNSWIYWFFIFRPLQQGKWSARSKKLEAKSQEWSDYLGTNCFTDGSFAARSWFHFSSCDFKPFFRWTMLQQDPVQTFRTEDLCVTYLTVQVVQEKYKKNTNSNIHVRYKLKEQQNLQS